MCHTTGLAAGRRTVLQCEAVGGVGRLRGASGNMESSEVMRVTMGEAVCAVMGEAGKGEEMRRRAASVSRVLVDVWELHGGSSA